MIRPYTAILSTGLLAGLLTAIAPASPAQTLAASVQSTKETHRSLEHDFALEVVAEGLDTPWSMAWLPDGTMLVTERPGRLRIVRDGVLLKEPVTGVPEVHAVNQGGLFEVLPHPDFASNSLLYLSFAAEMPRDNSGTTIVRGRFENDSLTQVETLFQADSHGRNGHYGGRMVFDGEGHLFLTMGDRQVPLGDEDDLAEHPAQDLSDHNGTIVRIDEDGGVPDDNPFVDTRRALPEIWSYGHRNSHGLAVHPETGHLWSHEHGPQGGDELNIVTAGANYGWPVVGYGVNYGIGTPIHPKQRERGMEQPKHFWTPSIATSGLMIYDGDLFPRWRGDLFIGGMVGMQVARIRLDDSGEEVLLEETLLGRMDRVRDIRQGPDGAIYLAAESRGILRLTPAD